jgi:Uma2 family endonuclease
MAAPSPLTAEELLRRRFPDKRVELIDGRPVVREPAGYRHGRIAARVAAKLTVHADTNELGVVCAAETGFVLRRGPDTVRAPDVAFISKARLPDPDQITYAELAPDLVVEVLSPGDRPGDLLAKVADWLNAGSRSVWVVDASRRLIRVYGHDGSCAMLREGDRLEGGDVVPGFSCEVSSLF